MKDYDTTSDKKVVIILSVQCGDPAWTHVMVDCIENGVKLSVALASKSLREGFPTGIWTNANIICMKEKLAGEVLPDLNSFKKIMELAARTDTATRTELHEYLRQRYYRFEKDTVYILVTPYLNGKSISEIIKLRKIGISFKIIDVSKDGNLPYISGIEKVTYKEETAV